MMTYLNPPEGFKRFVWISGAVMCCLLSTSNNGYANSNESLKTLSQQETINIKGVVRNLTTNQPIAGVTVSIPGTSIATTTNINGQYELRNVPKNGQITFSVIGMTPISESIEGRPTINANLNSVSENIDEVIVVGYGTQKKAVVSGAIATVKGDELAKSSSVNLSNSFAGRLPGVTAMQNSGEPGYDGSSIRIRGINSLSGGNSDPLIVIDGVPQRAGGIDRINPNDVESVSVLKDASAAIYGSRAGNGVILITTKQGKSGKPTLSYDLNVGIGQPTRLPKMANSEQYTSIINEVTKVYPEDPAKWGDIWEAFNTADGIYNSPAGMLNPIYSPEQ